MQRTARTIKETSVDITVLVKNLFRVNITKNDGARPSIEITKLLDNNIDVVHGRTKSDE
jgi:hypothetical protein